MCEFTKVFEDSKPKYQQWKKGINAPQNNFYRGVLCNVQQGICPVCGRRLSFNDMNPKKACTRSLCGSCYQEIIVSQINTYCLVCEIPLPNEKVEKQHKGIRGRREVKNHLHEECVSSWALMHSTVVGYPRSARKVLQSLRSQSMGQSVRNCQKPEIKSNDVIIDAVFISEQPRSLIPGRRALPLPSGKVLTFDKFFDKSRKGKNILVLPLPRK